MPQRLELRGCQRRAATQGVGLGWREPGPGIGLGMGVRRRYDGNCRSLARHWCPFLSLNRSPRNPQRSLPQAPNGPSGSISARLPGRWLCAGAHVPPVLRASIPRPPCAQTQVERLSALDLRSEAGGLGSRWPGDRGDGADAAEAEARLALVAFERLGAVRHGDGAAGLLRELGAAGRAWPKSHRTLTKRENEVLSLLATGCSNAEIAIDLSSAGAPPSTTSGASCPSSACAVAPRRPPTRSARRPKDP